jgi:FtsH-binding integral membrane protein
MTIILDAIAAIAISFGIVGLHELDRGGHRRVKRILSKCVFGWLAACFVLVCIMLIFKDHTLEPVFEYLLYPFLALIAASFPLALYLNRDQNKSKAQPTISNAP